MNIMHPVLRRIDLNLLPVFDAVYRSRSVRLAAEELAMSTGCAPAFMPASWRPLLLRR